MLASSLQLGAIIPTMCCCICSIHGICQWQSCQLPGKMMCSHCRVLLPGPCRSCGHVSSVTDSFTHLSLDLPTAGSQPVQEPSLAELMARHFK